MSEHAGWVEWPPESDAAFQLHNFTLELWLNPAPEQAAWSAVAGNLQSDGLARSGWGLVVQREASSSAHAAARDAALPVDVAWAQPPRAGESTLHFVVCDGPRAGAARESLRAYALSEPAARLPHGVWTHVAVAYDPMAGARLYTNGSLAATRAARPPGVDYSLRARMRLGAVLLANGDGTSAGAGAWAFRGGVDEVRLWGFVRSAAQLRETLRERLAGVEGGLAGYWPMDHREGVFVLDVAVADCGVDPGWSEAFLPYGNPPSGAHGGPGAAAGGAARGACGAGAGQHHAGMVRGAELRWVRSDVEWRHGRAADGLLRLPLGVGQNLLLEPDAVPCVPLWGTARREEAVQVSFLGKVRPPAPDPPAACRAPTAAARRAARRAATRPGEARLENGGARGAGVPRGGGPLDRALASLPRYR